MITTEVIFFDPEIVTVFPPYTRHGVYEAKLLPVPFAWTMEKLVVLKLIVLLEIVPAEHVKVSLPELPLLEAVANTA